MTAGFAEHIKKTEMSYLETSCLVFLLESQVYEIAGSTFRMFQDVKFVCDVKV